MHRRMLGARAGSGEPPLQVLADDHNMLDGAAAVVACLLGARLIDEQHAGLGIVADFRCLPWAQARIDGGQWNPRLGRARHDLQVLDAVLREDGAVGARLNM